ncbi:DUF6998 domain-containing protein [Chloroflexota bacterium]
MAGIIDINFLRSIVEKAIDAARGYRKITGKPLGITGEVGEFLVADLMELALTEVRQPGYDAIADDERRIQIKARCIPPFARGGQRLGSIKLDHEWDTVMLILMNMDYEPFAIYEAKRNLFSAERNRESRRLLGNR